MKIALIIIAVIVVIVILFILGLTLAFSSMCKWFDDYTKDINTL